MSAVPVLSWSPVVGRQNNAQVLCDSLVSQSWNISLYGTGPNNDLIRAKTVIVDNMGNNATAYFTYGLARYQVAPYTRKTIYLLPDQLYVIFSVSIGVLTLTFCDFDPDLPEEVNQVATNISGAAGGSGTGGGTGTYATLNPLDKGIDVTLSGGNLTAASLGGWQTTRSNVSKTVGKWYLEATSGGANCILGVCNASAALNNYLGFDVNGYGFHTAGSLINNDIPSGAYGNWASGGVACIAVDIPLARAWFRIPSGYWNGNPAADPAAGTNGISIAGLGATIYFGVGSYNSITVNFGASPFQGSIPTSFTGVTG